MGSTLRLGLLFVISLLLSACVNVTKPLSTRADVDPDAAYIFGRFTLDARSYDSDISLIIKNISLPHKKTYGLHFNKKDDVYAIKVLPGRYRIQGIQYGASGNLMKTNNEMGDSEILNKEFEIKANNAYYFGDWEGNAKFESTGYSHIYHWKITNLIFDRQATHAQLLTKYKNLSALPAQDVFDDTRPKMAYTPTFNRADPATYTVRDLHSAMFNHNYVVASKVANHLADTDPDAEATLGYLYAQGYGMDENISKGLEHLKSASDKKSSYAPMYIGILKIQYANSPSGDRSKTLALQAEGIKLINMAALLDNLFAIRMNCRAAKSSTGITKLIDLAWCKRLQEKVDDSTRPLINDTPAETDFMSNLSDAERLQFDEVDQKLTTATHYIQQKSDQ